MVNVLADLRYSVRRLRRSPAFAVTAILTLALGIGANTAIFSTVNTLLLRPYPFPNLDLLMLAQEEAPNQPGEQRVAAADLVDWKGQSRSFEQFAAFRFSNFNLSSDETQTASVEGYVVSPSLFEIIEARPLLGRTFAAEEAEQGKNLVAILSHNTWREQFGSAANVVGKAVIVNGRKVIIVGVMPPGFHYPLGAELWMPLTLSPAETVERSSRSLFVLGRLKDGASVKTAGAELQAINNRLQQQYPASNTSRTVHLLPLRAEQYAYTAPMFLLLQAAAIFVLLLACANLLNLMFAQAVTRRREMAVRGALGAGKFDLARLFSGESLLITLLAAAAAVSVSVATVNAIRNGMPYGMTKWIAGWSDIRVESRVLWFATALAFALAILLATVSTSFGARVNLNQALKESSGTSTGDRRLHRLLASLVVVQVVFAVVLLTGAGSAIRGFFQLTKLFHGFNPDNLLVLEIALPKQTSSAQPKVITFFESVVRQVKAIPGVESASLAANYPASNVDSQRIQFKIEGRAPLREEEIPSADLQVASADLCRALQISLIRGRFFSDSDGRDTARVAVISQAMAQRFWPGGNAIGQSLKLGAESIPAAVVGVVGDVKLNWTDPQMRPTVYVPYTQWPKTSLTLLVRTAGQQATLPDSIRQQVREINPDAALNQIHTLTGEIADSLAPIRIIGRLMLVFGAVALCLSTVGIYAVLSHRVARRTREFGLRMAMGATSDDLLRLIMRESLKLAGIGLLVGFPLAIAVSMFGASQLFGLNGLNLPMLIAFAVGILSIAALAGFVPARRAMRCDPAEALHCE